MRAGDMAKEARGKEKEYYGTASYRPVGGDSEIRVRARARLSWDRDFATTQTHKPTILVTLLGSHRTECPLP